MSFNNCHAPLRPDGVARSDCYQWLLEDRGATDSQVDVRVRIRELNARWYGTLRYRPMHEELKVEGYDMTQRTIRRLMAEEGLHGCPIGRRSPSCGRSGSPVAPDLLRREFKAAVPNTK